MSYILDTIQKHEGKVNHTAFEFRLSGLDYPTFEFDYLGRMAWGDGGSSAFMSLAQNGDYGLRLVGGLTTAVWTIGGDITLEGGHSRRPLVLNIASGCTVTLPTATGSGNKFEFYINTTVTSNAYVIKVGSAAESITGIAWLAQDSAQTAAVFEDYGGSSDTITMNGSTTGGFKGGIVTVVDVAANSFVAEVKSAATGIEVTPFSATVS